MQALGTTSVQPRTSAVYETMHRATNAAARVEDLTRSLIERISAVSLATGKDGGSPIATPRAVTCPLVEQIDNHTMQLNNVGDLLQSALDGLQL